MFERIFSRPAVVWCHQQGPLAAERSAYLEALLSDGATPKTLRRKAQFILWLALRLADRPAERRVTDGDLEDLSKGWAKTTPWSSKRFRSTAADWLRRLDRLASPSTPCEGSCDRKIDDFIKTQLEERGLAAETCKNWRKQVRLFLSFAENQGWSLLKVTPEQIDTYFQHLGQKWRRYSIKHAACSLRAWFRHCEIRNWTRPKLADVILSPRIYRYEGLPVGPTWEEVRRAVASTDGDEPMQLRDRAVLMLLAVYGMRPGELRRLTLDDIDWKKGQIRIIRSKTSKVDTFPLERTVGNALATYLRHARPRCKSRALLATMQAPYRPLSQERLYEIVSEKFAGRDSGNKKCGPQLLRHACAQHLLETGHSFKQVGDHLGHRDPMTTRIYAKVDLRSLRLVAMEELGGLK